MHNPRAFRRKGLQPRCFFPIRRKRIAAEAAAFAEYLLPLLTCAVLTGPTAHAAGSKDVLDDFRDTSAWTALASDQVSSSLHAAKAGKRNALCLAYDFNGVSGHAAMRRELPIEFPANYEFDFNVRGNGAPNQFEFKLIDASGDNVWWVSKPKTMFPSEWTPVRYKKRHILPAWGPLTDKTLRKTQFVEFTVYANDGGKGEVCIDDLRLREREVVPTTWPTPSITASSGKVSPTLFDGTVTVPYKPGPPPYSLNLSPFELQYGWRERKEKIEAEYLQSLPVVGWRSAIAASGPQQVTADFGRAREFGGLILQWAPDRFAKRYDIELSDDAKRWRIVRHVVTGNGGLDSLDLPESEARYLRISMIEGPQPQFGLTGVEIKDFSFGASQNAFLQSIAKESPRGQFPRGFSGEQTYWTLIGIDGGHQSGLLGEDGAIEVARGGFSIVPFVNAGPMGAIPLVNVTTTKDAPSGCDPESGRYEGENGRRSYNLRRLDNWSRVAIGQVLFQRYLPMPGVRWTQSKSGEGSVDCETKPGVRKTMYACGSYDILPWHLDIYTFAQGTPETSRIFATYTLTNDSDRAQSLTLALAIQPFQVNPPIQFLTTPGGVSPINELGFDGSVVSVNGAPRVRALQPPTKFFATPFDADMAAQHLSYTEWPTAQWVKDDTSFASGALTYRIELEPHASRTITLDIPLSGRPSTPKLPADDLQQWVDAQRAAVADEWRGKLDRVKIKVPASAQPIVDTLRTALAHILINRNGVQIRPGTRSYARSWIRDGAMTAEALLRLGHADEARAFLEWYAPNQFANGKVPCCVDQRGADPVPENDSHGELVFLAAETARYTQDRALAETMWPHVEKATRYLDELRASQRTAANRGTEKYGLLSPSISHEGYSAKPAYSHWDNFWGLIGYTSAITLAEQLGRTDDAQRLAASRAEFRGDILASIDASAKKFNIDFIPGAADLGDFDATSTTIALSPGGEREHLPTAMLTNTFERYWREFVQRRDGTREWKDYTPYEWRNVSAFIRLGWRERAHEAIAYFFKDRRPEAWNQWAEVVGREYREPRFIGDMPHGWVASDFIRAALDLFAYERPSDRSMVLAAGVLPSWLEGEGMAIDGLHTPYGVLGYSLRRDGDKVLVSVRGDASRMPPGGFVLVWPDESVPGRTRINGKAAKWAGRELRIAALPAEVVIRFE